MAPDVRRYAAGLQVTPPSLRTWPPNSATLVNLPTFFGATAPGSGRATVGGQGYTLQISVAATRYDWSFGDGATLVTNDPGAGPPDGSARHTYSAAGDYTVTARIEYGATYSVVTPFGTFGPQTVPGGPVRTLPALTTLHVREAHAGLVG
ncbi:MAG TPA: PKD domain-containing protein [Mycobacteriales bacterium]